uniref:Uncharacterized protein n=1 Tax=Megaselia scalaris TaxID=36166 RepID=T1H3G9_MEGSC
MVQYFRNYIVRPVGSLSAASTVDSLSSSFICNSNEANTLVPPPYSRAASPEIGIHSQFQQSNQIIPRHQGYQQQSQLQNQQPQSPLQQFPSRDIEIDQQPQSQQLQLQRHQQQQPHQQQQQMTPRSI